MVKDLAIRAFPLDVHCVFNNSFDFYNLIFLDYFFLIYPIRRLHYFQFANIA